MDRDDEMKLYHIMFCYYGFDRAMQLGAVPEHAHEKLGSTISSSGTHD